MTFGNRVNEGDVCIIFKGRTVKKGDLTSILSDDEVCTVEYINFSNQAFVKFVTGEHGWVSVDSLNVMVLSSKPSVKRLRDVMDEE